jgi:recombination protein RecT
MPKATKKGKNSQPKTELMITKDETVDVVLTRIQEFQNSGELHLPDNYSAPNALKSAWLMLQNTLDKDKKPVLEVCTNASIANALLDMVVQGLNPSKMQCYFIAYGRVLTLSRSYMGNVAISLRVDTSLEDIFAECVYEGDVIEYNILLGQRNITSHTQSLENVKKDNIVAAYAVAVTKEGVVKRTELMTMDEIKAAWSQSKIKPVSEKGTIKAGSTHDKFSAEMAKKTVTNRMTKRIISKSDDATLATKVIESTLRTMDLAASADAQSLIEEDANKGEVIDIKQEAKKPAEKKTARDPEPEKDEPEPMSDDEKRTIVEEEAVEAADEGTVYGSKKTVYGSKKKAPF